MRYPILAFPQRMDPASFLVGATLGLIFGFGLMFVVLTVLIVKAAGESPPPPISEAVPVPESHAMHQLPQGTSTPFSSSPAPQGGASGPRAAEASSRPVRAPRTPCAFCQAARALFSFSAKKAAGK